MITNTPSENGAPHDGRLYDGREQDGGVRPPTGTPRSGPPPLPRSGGASAGDLSERALTRLANDMFVAPPGSPGVSSASSAPAGGAPAVRFDNASSSHFGEFEEQRLRSTLGPRLAPSHSAPSQPPVAGPVAGSLPARPSLAGLSPAGTGIGAQAPAHPTSPFYFLNENHRFGGNAPSAGPLREIPPVQGPSAALTRRPFDVHAVRRDFPILSERVNGGKPLVWLDNAATTHKPHVVIQRIVEYYTHENSNIHRAAHELAARSTDAYEKARETVARFLNAPSSKEIVFTRGATEAINLVAQTWGRQHIATGDEILITHLEHHANIVPWRRLADEHGATLRVAPVDDRGELILSELQKLLTRKTRLVAFPQVSNALGTVTPAQQIIDMAHRAGALALVDGAQSVAHMRQDVTALDADFFVFSGHKIFAPTGIGVLYGKTDLLDAMQPWQGGGNMIDDVTFEKVTYQAAPARFEAGTGSIADAVGLGAALEYLEALGIDNVNRYEHDLLAYGTSALKSVKDLRLIGTAPEKAGVLSFVIDGLRNEDIGAALSHEGIAVRSGHHCAQPILRRLGLESTVRPSLALYNTPEEIDVLVAALKRIRTGIGAGRA